MVRKYRADRKPALRGGAGRKAASGNGEEPPTKLGGFFNVRVMNQLLFSPPRRERAGGKG
jgi:hypothetical protein